MAVADKRAAAPEALFFGPEQMAPGYHGSAAALMNLGVWIGPAQPTRLILVGCGVMESNQKEPPAQAQANGERGVRQLFR